MEELAILLEACAPRLNRHRFWRVRMGRDLFGLWHARVTFGRIGRSGRTLRYDFGSREDAEAFVRASLKRRRGAPQRCGAAYRLIEASTGPHGLTREEIPALIGASVATPMGVMDGQVGFMTFHDIS